MRRLARAVRGGPVPRHGVLPTGVPREPVAQRTNIGPMLDDSVARIRAMMTPAGVDPDYDVAYERFDLTHFLLQARHMLSLPKIDPLRVFLENGAEAKASPEINFNMEAYLERHPERESGTERSPYLAWIKHGRAAGEIADPAPGIEKAAVVLGSTPAELTDLLARTRLDLQDRLLNGELGRMLAAASEIEPLVGDAWTAATLPMIPPLPTRDIVDQMAAIHACQEAAGFARARVLMVVAEPRWGGGRRAEGHIAHALADRIDPAEIVVIYTDEGGTAPPGRFPAGVREVDFTAAVADVEPFPTQRALVEVVRSFGADAVLNVNSRLLYQSMSTYGRALAASERIFPVMFCNEQLAIGTWAGIPLRFFYRSMGLVSGVLTDSAYLADWLRTRHQLDEFGGDLLHVLRAPVDPAIEPVPAPSADPGRRPQIFWAGRWDRQKRVDLALEIARRMPDVDVRVWGEPVLTTGQMRGLPDNVRVEGRYDEFSELPLAEADLWLYTSAWDGVPSQLLEVAMTGIPVVASLVGGTGEVLDEAGAWRVADVEDPDAYVSAIREVLADRSAARDRAAGLRERLLKDRTEVAYAEQVADLLLLEPGEDGGR